MKILFVTYPYKVKPDVEKDAEAFRTVYSKCNALASGYGLDQFSEGDKTHLAAKMMKGHFDLIHFSLHGENHGSPAVFLSDDVLLTREDFLNLLTHAGKVKAVVLNCCHSREIAQYLCEKLNLPALGWGGKPIREDAAEITLEFYTALYHPNPWMTSRRKIALAFRALEIKRDANPGNYGYSLFRPPETTPGPWFGFLQKMQEVWNSLLKTAAFTGRRILKAAPFILLAAALLLLSWSFWGKPSMTCNHTRSAVTDEVARVEISIEARSPLFPALWLKTARVNLLWMKPFWLIVQDPYTPVQHRIGRTDFRWEFDLQRDTRYFLVSGKDTLCRNEIKKIQ